MLLYLKQHNFREKYKWQKKKKVEEMWRMKRKRVQRGIFMHAYDFSLTHVTSDNVCGEERWHLCEALIKY